MQLPKAIILDLDDTILDDSGRVDDCWKQACGEATALIDGLDSNSLLAAIEQERDWFWSDAERTRAGRLDLRSASTRIVEQALRSLGHSANAASNIAGRYRDLREERIKLFPGAIETIEWLRGHSVRLGMATNGSAEGQRAKINRFGLEPYFDCIIVEGEFGHGKPQPQVYRALFTGLAEAPGEMWSVGDNLELDVRAPQSFGVYGIWVNAGKQDLPDSLGRPDRIISSIQELMEVT